LCNASGTPLPGPATRRRNPGEFVFDLEWALGKPVRVPATTLTGANVDPELLNARVVLSGGNVEEMDCAIEPGIKWTFPNGETRQVTDSAVFTHEIGDAETLSLRINNLLLPIKPGDEFVFANEDTLGGPFGEFVQLQEFEALCHLAGIAPLAFPLNVLQPNARFQASGPFLQLREPPRGTDAVCAIASLPSDV
jgi:hypothetical protein